MNEPQEKPHWWTRLLHRPGWLVVLAVCLLLGGFVGRFAWRYHRTQQLVAGIEACGGAVFFEPGGPLWLRNLLGEEWMKPFDVPRELQCLLPFPRRMRGTRPPINEIDDDGFLTYVVPLDEIYGLKGVALCNHEMTHRSFESLRKFNDLERFSISGEEFDDQALSYLSGASKLRALDLSGTSVSDEGLRHLYGLKHLETLSLSNTDVTEQGVEELQRRLPGLDVSDD